MNKYLFLSLFVLLSSCQNHQTIKVEFENADGLTTNDPIFMDSIQIGLLTGLELSSNNTVIATFQLKDEVKLPQSAHVQYEVDFLGNAYIQILRSGSSFILDNRRVLSGSKIEPDTSNFQRLSQEQLDSLIKTNPHGQLMDTIMNFMRSLTKEKYRLDSLDRTGTIIK